MSLAIVGAGVGIAGTAYSVYNSAHKASQANKLAKENIRPVFNPDGSIKELKDLAIANYNDTDLQDFGAEQIQKRQSQAIDAVLKSGGKVDFGTVNGVFGNDLQALMAQLKMKKDSNLALVNNATYNEQQQQDAIFQYNRDAPYKDKALQEAALRQQSEQSKADAFNTAASTVSNYGVATNRPGAYANPTGRQQNRAINSELDNTLAIDTASPVAAANPVLSQPQAAPAGAINTNFDYTNFRTIVGYNKDGSPIYG